MYEDVFIEDDDGEIITEEDMAKLEDMLGDEEDDFFEPEYEQKNIKKSVWISVAVVIFIIASVILIIFLINADFADKTNVKKEVAVETPQVKTEVENSNEEEITYGKIYSDYKKNALAAQDKYKNNRYTVSAKVLRIEPYGERALVTLTAAADKTVSYFFAEFDKQGTEKLKNIEVGDDITFEGKCIDYSDWEECEVID